SFVPFWLGAAGREGCSIVFAAWAISDGVGPRGSEAASLSAIETGGAARPRIALRCLTNRRANPTTEKASAYHKPAALTAAGAAPLAAWMSSAVVRCVLRRWRLAHGRVAWFRAGSPLPDRWALAALHPGDESVQPRKIILSGLDPFIGAGQLSIGALHALWFV